jgi:outer membrane lipoprotein-sorting protein
MILWALILLSRVAAGQLPADVLQKVDAVRNPAESYRMDVRVISSEEREPAVFQVFLKGNDKTLVKVLGPRKNLGRNMLMLGESMWVYIPNLKRAVRVSLSQKLVGQAANGDISRMRWAGDYTANLAGEDKQSWQLRLTATKKGLTYDRLLVWVQKKTFHPLKAHFLTVSGKVVKEAEYLDYKTLVGKQRPSRIRITDHLDKKRTSDIVVDAMGSQVIPDALFSEHSLE